MLKAFFTLLIATTATNTVLAQCATTQYSAATTKSATCVDDHNTAIDANIKMTSFVLGQRYQYCVGASFNSAAAIPSNIIEIPGDGIIAGGLQNPSANEDYTIRVYDASDDNCYTDIQVVLHQSLCATIAATETYTLTAPAGLVNYQWYLNGVLIPGANSKTYIADKPGQYSYKAQEPVGNCAQEGCTPVQLTTPVSLPVQMVYFVAAANDCEVNLRWQTASELNNKEFQVQRSNSNNVWTTIGVVQGSGTINAPRLYSYIDKKPMRENLYRLLQIDYDGTTTAYSAANRVETNGCFDDTDNGVTLVYPNPNSTDQAWLKFYTDKGNQDVDVILTDVLGRILMVQTAAVQNGANIVAINIADLPNGHYYLYVKGENWFSDTQKLVRLGKNN